MSAVMQMLAAGVGSGVVLPFVTADGGAGNVSSTVSATVMTFNSDGTITIDGTPTNIQSSWMRSGSFWVRGRYTSGSGTGGFGGTLQGNTVNTWSSWLTSGTITVGVFPGFLITRVMEFQVATDSGGSDIVATSASVTITGNGV